MSGFDISELDAIFAAKEAPEASRGYGHPLEWDEEQEDASSGHETPLQLKAEDVFSESAKSIAVESPTLDSPIQGKIEAITGRGQLPAALDAEKSILGAILLDNAAYQEANASLSKEDFSLDSNQRIFARMGELIESGHAVDIITLSNELARRKEVENIGGIAYLASLTEGLPRRISIEEYVRIVADKSILRKVIGTCEDTMRAAVDGREQGMELVTRASEKIIGIATSTKAAWRTRPKREVFVGGSTFLRSHAGHTEWTVDKLIQRGGNGLVVGDPGASKSMLTLDLAIHLVAGQSWMYHQVPRRMKVGYIAREDHPGLTQERGKKLITGASDNVIAALDEIDLDEWLYFNTRAQTETFSLQKESDVLEIIEAIKERGIEFAVFDVFRRLWEGDENDNQEVANVLAVLTRIQAATGCAVVLVHHINKSEGGTIFQRIRGASSIYGWREWAIGITIANPDAEPRDRIRKMEFETKADSPSNPIHYRIDGYSDKTSLIVCEPPEKRSSKKGKNGDIF